MPSSAGTSVPPPRRETDMEDIVFLAVIVVFFAACVAYVRGLDRLVRSGEETEGGTEVGS
jgi:hypothetical protein